MTTDQHRKEAPSDLHVKTITVSDSLAEKGEAGYREDKSGKIIQKKIEEGGYSSERVIVPDEGEKIEEEISEAVADDGVDAVITTGGTGITSRDKTADIAKKLFDKEFPGFGELFRRKSFDEIGTAVILSRATAGLVKQKPIFCLPGSPNSVETGMDLIISDLAHIIKHARE